MSPYIRLMALLPVALAGCASTNDILAKPIDEVFHLKEPADAVAGCFAAMNPHVRMIERPDGARVSIWRNGYGGATRSFSIYPEGNGSRVEVRSDSIQIPGFRWKACVGLKPMPALR